ncbi:MAG TPA: ABC transporter permease [Candidatus Acidoferrum sp.]|nr:ABC transporter permease [Candidatus Acidoferrum sp.]
MDTALQDIRYGLRALVKSPGFTAIASLTLALGIGANTAIFSLIDAVMLRSLPVRNPSELVIMQWRARHMPFNGEYSSFSDCGESGISGPSGCSFPLPIFKQIRSQTNAFSSVSAFAGPAALSLAGSGPATMVQGEIVSGDYFSTLGVNAAVGRTLGPNDDSPSASPVVVLSYAYWQSAFGGSRSVLGRTIRLNNIPFTIVGVAERRFTNLSPGKSQDLWLPIAMLPRLNVDWGHEIDGLSNWWLVIIARLKPGVSLDQAQTAASLVFSHEVLDAEKTISQASEPQILLTRVQEGLVGQRGMLSKMLYLLMVAVGVILLIACANVAGLLLSRGATRQKEIAVRLALGAGRARIVRQLLTESILLSVLGGVCGIIFAYWGVHVITALVTAGSSKHFPYVLGPDYRVLAFALGVCVATGILFGLAPALRSVRVDLAPTLKENISSLSSNAARVGRFHLGDTLVVAQVALSVLVLVGAGLAIRTLENLRSINPGFDTRNILLFEVDPTLLGYKDAQIENLYSELRQRLAALPGVASVTYASDALLDGGRWTETIHFEDQPQKGGVEANMLATGPEFFTTMHIPLFQGRMFMQADFDQASAAERARKENTNARSSSTALNSSGALVPISVLVNKAFVQQYYPTENPLGKHITKGGSSGSGGGAFGNHYDISKTWEIVGVVGDTKYDSLRRTIVPIVYVPLTSGGSYFELRTAADPRTLASAVRRAANEVDSNLPLSHVSTQTQVIDKALAQERLIALVSSFFALLALALACIGLYGLISYEVSRRTREIGIRMALGARRADVLRRVIGQGMTPALLGLGAGIIGALGFTRLLSSLLFGVKPTDPLTFIVVSLALTGVAAVACYIPARRAMRVDPMIALRYE